uniref:Uncharacterized protein n=1 Tax=Ditylenchus dipsaci TaxID=166011 RepID=A0A915E531_9BILA
MFLLGDTGRDDPERVLLFGREKHVDWSGEMKSSPYDHLTSFVPPAEIWGCFERLKNHLPADLAPVLNWFKRNYV